MGRPIKPGEPGDLPEVMPFSFTQTTFEEWDRRRNSKKISFLYFWIYYLC
jgi:hypothetical protein